MRALALALAAFALGPTPGRAATQAPPEVTDLLVRVNGPVRVAPMEEAFTVLVVGGDATIEGTLREHLVVVHGTARITGVVLGGVLVAGGHLELGPGATVAEDVTLVRGTLARHPDALVSGTVAERAGWPGSGVLRRLWIGLTLLMLAAAILFAASGGRQLGESARLLLARPGETLLAGLLLWLVLPALGLLLALSLVGLPLATGLLVFLLPALWFLGALVAAAALGTVLLRTPYDPRSAPVREAAAGVVALQLAAMVPAVGVPVLLLAGQAGAAALALRAWRGWQARRLVHPVLVQEVYP